MMREIVFDTETTGLDWRDERIIELGGIELVNRFPTGRSFHRYINPQGRQINAEAQAVHGISAADLVDKPIFGDIAEEFIAFIDGAHLVAHNAGFDIAFINAELDRIGQPGVDQGRVVEQTGPRASRNLLQRINNLVKTQLYPKGRIWDGGLLHNCFT